MSGSKLLGILGGLGPMATVYFYEMLTAHTAAMRDQDHIDMIISSKSTTPDRTAYILGNSDENPLDVMVEEAKKLERYGADLLVMPCNTAHYFFDRINESVNIPMLNIIDETVEFCRKRGYKKAGIMATDGTLQTNTYQMKLEEKGLCYAVPDASAQRAVMEIIYDVVKKGREINHSSFEGVANQLWDSGCDCIILGCTELSLVKKNSCLSKRYVDSMEVLAYSTIKACGKQVIGFEL